MQKNWGRERRIGTNEITRSTVLAIIARSVETSSNSSSSSNSNKIDIETTQKYCAMKQYTIAAVIGFIEATEGVCVCMAHWVTNKTSPKRALSQKMTTITVSNCIHNVTRARFIFQLESEATTIMEERDRTNIVSKNNWANLRAQCEQSTTQRLLGRTSSDCCILQNCCHFLYSLKNLFNQFIKGC